MMIHTFVLVINVVPSIQAKYQSTGQLFLDRRFPPVRSSLFYSCPAPNIEWRRPGELSRSPRMVVDGVDRFDINQVRVNIINIYNTQTYALHTHVYK